MNQEDGEFKHLLIKTLTNYEIMPYHLLDKLHIMTADSD